VLKKESLPRKDRACSVVRVLVLMPKYTVHKPAIIPKERRKEKNEIK